MRSLGSGSNSDPCSVTQLGGLVLYVQKIWQTAADEITKVGFSRLFNKPGFAFCRQVQISPKVFSVTLAASQLSWPVVQLEDGG